MKKILKKGLLLFGLCIGLWGINSSSVKAACEYDMGQQLDGLVPVSFYENGINVGYVSQPIRRFSEAKKAEFFLKANEENSLHFTPGIDTVDADLWDWFVKTKLFSDVDKYNYCMGIVATSGLYDHWLINNPAFTHEQKVLYFRKHGIRYTDDIIKSWWWENIGRFLTIEDVNYIDSLNMLYYRRALYNDIDGHLQSVRISGYTNPYAYMDVDDLNKCIEKGLVRMETHTILINGVESSAFPWNFYYSNVGLNTGYMMWPYGEEYGY